MSKASDKQVGGDHYKGKRIQPAFYCELNGLSMLESNIVKRISRWREETGGGLKDLHKIKHEVDLLIEIHDVKAGDAIGLGPLEQAPEEYPGVKVRYSK